MPTATFGTDCPCWPPMWFPKPPKSEMRAQIERTLAAGIDITHLDSHMGVALLPQLIDIYIRLGREYRTSRAVAKKPERVYIRAGVRQHLIK
jgi:predicted glycoside hydrolase/deacetylase ChbG (UPF0249 family)